MRRLRKNRGITLIALIVTIIILLILTGVVFDFIIGNNGILGKTAKAVNAYESEAARELLDLKIMEIDADCYQANNKKATFEELSKELEDAPDFNIEKGSESIFVSSVKYPEIIFEITNQREIMKLTEERKIELKSYTISYDLRGGIEGESTPKSAQFNTDFVVSNPTKEGYVFTGLAITGMDSSEHTYGSSTTTANTLMGIKDTSFKNLMTTKGTVTFTAHWEIVLFDYGTYNSYFPMVNVCERSPNSWQNGSTTLYDVIVGKALTSKIDLSEFNKITIEAKGSGGRIRVMDTFWSRFFTLFGES